MALVNFKQSTEAKILSAPISDGTFYVSTDTKKLYVDIDTKRVEVSANTNTTYVLSKSGSTITLRGSDGSTYNITDANTIYADATDSASGLMSAADKAKLDGIAAQANKIVVDASFSTSSTNPVQNKVIKAALDGKASSVHSHRKSQITDFPTSMPASDVYAWAKASTKPAYTATEVGAAAASHKHSATDLTSGTLEVDRLPAIPATKLTGTIAAANLPAYVDDVLEFANKTAFPSTGESGKIYVAQDINKTYRWGGTAYVEISPSLALGTTSSTAFRGDYGNTAYQHAVAKGSAFAHGMYKITTNSAGHVTAAQAITKSDITALGIPAQDTNTWIAMKGASASAAGGAGYVPAPTTGQQNLFLRGDGTWAQGPVGPKGDKGATGERGPQGIQGAQGPKGDKGLTGDKGATGERGPQGATGAAATIEVGTVSTGNPGTNATVVNAGTANAAIFNFTIPRGATGAIGPQGPAGAKGATGDTGPQGPAGAKGATGDRGPAGANGTSAAWHSGTLVTGTSTSAITVAVSGSKAGDMYLNTSTSNVYKATAANSWVYVCNIKGATGATGATGSAGPQGIQGPQGVQGPAGPAGAKGATGATGPQGPQGPAGVGLAEIAVQSSQPTASNIKLWIKV